MAVILIVDDEVFIRGVAELMVQDLGHETLAAGGIDEALANQTRTAASSSLSRPLSFARKCVCSTPPAIP